MIKYFIAINISLFIGLLANAQENRASKAYCRQLMEVIKLGLRDEGGRLSYLEIKGADDGTMAAEYQAVKQTNDKNVELFFLRCVK